MSAGGLSGDGHEFESEPDSVGSADSDTPVLAQVGGLVNLDRNGPHRFASYSIGFPRGRDHGGVTVFYPTDKQGPLPGVVMCPGFTALRSSIQNWGPFFASHGIVLVAMDTVTVLDQVPQRARGLAETLNQLKQENNRPGSPLNGKLGGDAWGLSGWSMGGGGTWIASAKDPSLKTAVTLAGHNLTAGGPVVSGLRNSRVPTLMMNGATDVTILGGLGQSEGSYDTIPNTTPKLLYVMALEGHFSWGGPRVNGNASGRYMMAWQRTFLLGEEQYKQVLRVRGPGASTWRSNVQ